MHRTEGANHDSNMFTDGPPGTNIEQNWMNAVQEEICYVIEQAGITLDTAGTETRTQLKDAINTMISGAGGVGSLQALDCNLNSNKEIIPTVDGSYNLFFGTIAKTFAVLSMRATDINIYADDDIIIDAVDDMLIECDGSLYIQSTTDNTADLILGTVAHSFKDIWMRADGTIYMDSPAYDIDCTGAFDIDASGAIGITSGTNIEIVGGATTKLRSDADNTDDLQIGDSTHDWKDIYLYVQGYIYTTQSTVIGPSVDGNHNLEIGDIAHTYQNISMLATTGITLGCNSTITIETSANDVNIIGADDVNISSSDEVTLTATDYVYINSVLQMPFRSSDPAYPAEDEGCLWFSDGTGEGQDGDLVCGSNVGGTTKSTILFDYSSGSPW